MLRSPTILTANGYTFDGTAALDLDHLGEDPLGTPDVPVGHVTALSVAAANGSQAAPPDRTRPDLHEPALCPAAAVNHFLFSELKRDAFEPIPDVSLVGPFGSTFVTLKDPIRLCAPADKADETPFAPAAPDHLTGYVMRTPAAAAAGDTLDLVNQFGRVQVQVVRPDRLLVPTAIGVVPPSTPAVDHLACYKLAMPRGAPRFVPMRDVKVDDPFGTQVIDVVRPSRLCVPVDKNGENPGAETHPDHLLCYRSRSRTPFMGQPVQLADQFGTRQRALIRRQELCVPTHVVP